MHGGVASLSNTVPAATTPDRPLIGEEPLGRVLVLTGSIGAGHTRAAEAVREAIERSRAADTVHVADCLAHANRLFRGVYRELYLSLIERAPGAVGWLYRSSDTVEGGGARKALQHLALAGLRRLIRDERPDTIVCTHFLASEVVSAMKARGEWSGTLGVVVTDLDAHAMWAACPSADRWFVALPETAVILAGKGVAPDRIAVTGIPIAGAFSAKPAPRTMLRESHGLPVDGPCLLVSGGGVGVSLLDSTFASLLDMDLDCGIALVCGRNERARRAAEAIVASRPDARVRCTVLGFTDRMHELMRACDLSVGKPGGLTSCEALACGLPMALVRPVPGQEERNAAHLLEWGVAIALNSPESLAWRVREILGDPERLAAMRRRALERARPFAADAVVDGLVELSRRQPPARSGGVRAGRATTRPASR
jgi:processive 1,2-diacylglycerol beta-glucosyltransferase